MIRLTHLTDIIINPKRILLFIVNKLYFFMPDVLFLKIKFFLLMGERLKLKHPKTFNQKLQWLKLYNRKVEYTKMVDKYAVKAYVAELIGEQYIIPTLGIYDDADSIDYENLPSQFVLKTTHGGGGGGIVICKDKSLLDKKKVEKNLQKSLRADIYKEYREWPYKNVPKKIIAEKFMSNHGEDLVDYKIHVFNGRPKFILICKDRFKDSPMIDDFYSTDWQLLDMHRPGTPSSKTSLPKPELLDEMLELSKRLSVGIPFLRTDFYIIDNKIYFGELTFFPASGMCKFDPPEWDYVLGKWLQLPTNTNN